MRCGEQKFPDFFPDRAYEEIRKGVSVMLMVKKRDGRKEPFVVEKIVVSAIKSGAPPDVARTIAGDIERMAKEGMTTQEIKTKILATAQIQKPGMGEKLAGL